MPNQLKITADNTFEESDVEKLFEDLVSPEFYTWLNAADKLLSANNSAITSRLINWIIGNITSENNHLRRVAGYLLGKIQDIDSIIENLEGFIAILRGSMPDQRIKLIEAFGNLGSPMAIPEVSHALIDCIEIPTKEVLVAINDTFRKFGYKAGTKSVLIRLQQMVLDNDEFTKQVAISFLGNICNLNEHKEILKTLISQTKNSSDGTRYRLTIAFMQIFGTTKDPAVIKFVCDGLFTPNEDQQAIVSQAIYNLGENANEYVIKTLIEGVLDWSPYMQSYSANALANIGKKATIPAVIEALQKTLEESDLQNVQIACNQALAKLFPEMHSSELLVETSLKFD